MQARLGSRLRYTLQLPESLCAAPVPGMMVLTLVENAIKHGIEPALRGGEVTVTAMPTAGGVDGSRSATAAPAWRRCRARASACRMCASACSWLTMARQLRLAR
jgi:hypothetical protein